MTSLNRGLVDAERRRRMAEAYGDDRPGDAEIAQARHRLALSRAARVARVAERPLSRVWAVGLAQGFVVGMVSLAAASFVAAKALPRWTAWQAAREVEARSAQDVRAPVAPQRRPLPAAPGAVPAGDVSPPGAAFSAEPYPGRSEPAVARAVPVRVSPAVVVSAGPGTLQKAPVAAPPPEVAVTSVPSLPSSDGPWARVAQALAAGDFTTADATLRTLSESSDVSTRDAAALSRAELWMARGNGALVTSTLSQLAETGRTPFIRRRAAELLERARGSR